jgi:hypothetical protein
MRYFLLISAVVCCVSSDVSAAEKRNEVLNAGLLTVYSVSKDDIKKTHHRRIAGVDTVEYSVQTNGMIAFTFTGDSEVFIHVWKNNKTVAEKRFAGKDGQTFYLHKWFGKVTIAIVAVPAAKK